jgi:predicted O-methyltransferase YrrM
MTDKDLTTAIPILQQLLWADRADREHLQQHGLNLVPANFYSSIPSVSEVLESYEYRESTPPYLDTRIFHASRLRENLIGLLPFSADFNPAEHDNEETCRRFFWRNSQFSYSDAMSYYAYLRQIKPRRVVEIGSGFSSLIAIEALQRNGFGSLTCIEPYPRPFINALAHEGALDLRVVRAQDVTHDVLDAMLENGDVLFIDSTHTVKTGSDCLHIYLRLLPNITKKIVIHVHDIFLPFGMPQDWLLDTHIYWTEQYLLMAWMIDNPRVTLLYGSAYHGRFNGEHLDSLMRGRFQRGGSSFWIQYDGTFGR